MIGLIDGDVIAFEASLAAEQETQWDDDIWTLHSDEREAIDRTAARLHQIQSKLKLSGLVVALSDPASNFRKSVLPSYKANRKDKRKPLAYRGVRKYLAENHKVFERPGLEGDDVLGILATSDKIVSGDKVIVSIDKDMKTIPGKLYNTRNPDDGIVSISAMDADRAFLFQTLTGDAVDGYKGCPGIGPQKAEKIIDLAVVDYNTPPHGAAKDDFVSFVWPHIVAAFKQAGLTEADALQQARVARILRSNDYDFKAKQPILWSPNV